MRLGFLVSGCWQNKKTMPPRFSNDLDLVNALLTGKPKAWERFLDRIADTTWTACTLLTRSEGEARAAFSEVLSAIQADGFRRFRPYDGSSRIETFSALVTREILAERLLRQLGGGGDGDPWTCFVTFFGKDILRIIARRLPGESFEEARRDAYQEVCLALVADGFRRLKAYQGTGSFGGFVLQTVDRLVIDFIRSTTGRYRGSEHQVQERILVTDAGDEVLELVPCGQPSPEQSLLAAEEDMLLQKATSALQEALATMTEAERLYVRSALSGAEPLPAREVARLMGRPVQEVYKLRQRVIVRLREILDRDPAVKKWRETV